MFRRHITAKDLLNYCENHLAVEQLSRIKAHLDACSKCAGRQNEIMRGVSFARQLRQEPLPSEATERIRSFLRAEAKTFDQAQKYRKTGSAVLHFAYSVPYYKLFLIVLLSGLAYLFIRSPLEIRRASAVTTEFESTAIRYYKKQTSRKVDFDLATTSPAQARAWIADHLELESQLAIDRPAADRNRYQLQGVKAVSVAGVPAALVSYEVDSQPVILLTARAEDIRGIPASHFFSKKIFFHIQPDSKVLTWNSSGQVYTLVSNLPDHGKQSCFLCHTNAKRRRLIENTRPR